MYLTLHFKVSNILTFYIRFDEIKCLYPFTKHTAQKIIGKPQSMAMSWFKVRLTPSKQNCVICVIESPSKMMKNPFYFILKALSVLKIFKTLSWLFGHAGKTAWLER